MGECWGACVLECMRVGVHACECGGVNVGVHGCECGGAWV